MPDPLTYFAASRHRNFRLFASQRRSATRHCEAPAVFDIEERQRWYTASPAHTAKAPLGSRRTSIGLAPVSLASSRPLASCLLLVRHLVGQLVSAARVGAGRPIRHEQHRSAVQAGRPTMRTAISNKNCAMPARRRRAEIYRKPFVAHSTPNTGTSDNTAINAMMVTNRLAPNLRMGQVRIAAR